MDKIFVGWRNGRTGKFVRFRFGRRGWWVPVYIQGRPAYVDLVA